MKRRKQELDVDFIGGAEPLTKEEEQSISHFLQSKKTASAQKRSTQHRLGKRAAEKTKVHQ